MPHQETSTGVLARFRQLVDGNDDAGTTDWVTRTHPYRDVWVDDEARMRATFHARRSDLAHYLVPHRFEATKQTERDPETLDRAGLGYGISLNESYLHEVFGHIRSAAATWQWGPLSDASEDEEGTAGPPPADTRARTLWEDATGDNTSWRNFFQGEVLEWMLSSVGGYVLVDAPVGQVRSRREEMDAGVHPFVEFVPMSKVWDLGHDQRRLRWIKIHESVDDRTPKGSEDDFSDRWLLYRLTEDGRTTVERVDEDGDPVLMDGQGEPVMDLGVFEDRQGQPRLPLVQAGFGTHPDIAWLASGLLMGLDDIVIDTFNVTNEMRAGYREMVITLLAYSGGEQGDIDNVKESLEEGTRLVDLGEEGTLERIAADSGEIQAGLAQIEMNLRAWAQSARRRASDAMERAEARSGVSLQAEFQLDIAPLLREVAERLDDVESEAMHLVAQMSDKGLGASDLEDVGVQRNREFRPEDEASRIARIVDDFRDGWSLVPARAKTDLVMSWLEATEEINLDAEVEMEGGETQTLREILPARIEELASLSERNLRQRATLTGPLVQDDAA